MEKVTFLISIASVYFVLAASPGPNFLIISLAATNKSKLYASFVALGVSTASLIWSSLAVTGLGILLSKFQNAQNIIQVLGGLYLFYIGAKTILKANVPFVINSIKLGDNDSYFSAYKVGLITNLGNPKTLIFFTSVFAGAFTNEIDNTLKILSILVVGIISISWNFIVVLAFSSKKAKAIYAKNKLYLDIVAGIVICLFGLKIMFAL